MGSDSLQTSFWVMVLIQSIGSVDMPGRGQRKMPSPRQYIAIVVTWTVLFLIAGVGEGARRATASLGWLMVLAGMVIGPFGVRVIGLFNTVATNFGSTSSPGQQVADTVGTSVADTTQGAS
jgi:hypothetical protein